MPIVPGRRGAFISRIVLFEFCRRIGVRGLDLAGWLPRGGGSHPVHRPNCWFALLGGASHGRGVLRRNEYIGSLPDLDARECRGGLPRPSRLVNL